MSLRTNFLTHRSFVNLRRNLAQLFKAVFLSSFVIVSAHAQVLTQTNKELGHGYRFQESKQVNVSGRWHSNQSFKFLYFDKRYLCQCTEYSISPSGKYAIFQMNSSLTIASFNRDKMLVHNHGKLPKGKLSEVIWAKNEKHAELHIQPEKLAGENTNDATKLIKTRLKMK